MTNKPTIRDSFAAALVAVLIAWGCHALLDRLFGGKVPFFTFLPAIFALAWWGGWRPTLVAVMLSCPVLVYFVLEPRFSFRIEGLEFQARLAMFVAVALATGWLGQKLHNARSAAQQAMEYALEERERLHLTLASIGDALIVTDEHGLITSLNAVAESLTGWESQKARGKRLDQVFRIVNEETRHGALDPCAKALGMNAPLSVPHRDRERDAEGAANHNLLISKDGSERAIENSAAPIVDRAGTIRGMIVVFRDVSDKRRAEKDLLRSQRELHDFFENAALPMHSVGPDGTILRANQAELDMLGYAKQEYVGRHIAHFYVDRHAIDEILARLSRGEIIHNYEARLRSKDGSIKDALITSSVLWEDGKFIHTRSFTRDITDRKRGRQAMEFLATATTTLATLSDHESALQQAVRITVPFIADWCVVYVANEHGIIEPHAFAHRDPGQEPRLAEMLTKYPLDWNSPTATVQALRTGKSQLMETLPGELLARIAQDAEQMGTIQALRPRSVISVPLRVRDSIVGAMSFVVSAPRSYTQGDLKIAENIADRTAIAIDNAQLFQAVKEASRQKDEFLAMLAHELRNPLAAIRYAGALGQISPADQLGRLWDIVERQTQNLARLIDDLLDVSRIRRNKVTMRKEPIDMSVIVQRAVATVRPLVEEKRHQLTLDVSDKPMPLVVDPTRTEQIIANLLTNAAKYTLEEGRITVSALPHEHEAVIKVTDSGVGLPQEMLSRVFDLFAQADRTLDRSQGGLGIGLTVARKLAEMQGGTVSAASDGLGHGSTFTLRLPLCETYFATREVPREQPAAPLRRSIRILVVDDNRDTAFAGALLLKTLGHEVETAFDGPGALELARAFRPQAFLLDIGLPGMTGYELAGRLRNDGFQDAKLIAVSGYGQPEDRRRSEEAGFDHHLVKPVDQDALQAVLVGESSKQ